MQIGVIGLGRMGANISRRLMQAGHSTVVWDANAAAVQGLGKEGAQGAGSLQGVVQALKDKPRAVWVMLPAGRITEQTVAQLGELMSAGDIVIDGGNTNYKDDVRRAKTLAAKGIRYIDCGTSGGVWGLERGYCLMIGGEKAAVDHLDPIFAALAPGIGTIERTVGREGLDPRAERGYIHAGPCGAGHFVKMIHNGIEYGMMQAMAEGFDILRNRASDKLPADERFELNVADIAEVWRRGSVVTSWLLDLTASAMAKDRDAGRLLRHGRGFRRRPLDRRGGDRGGGAGRCARRVAVRALPLAPGAHVRREGAVGDALRLRRPRGATGAEVMTIAVMMGVSGSGKTTIADGVATARRVAAGRGRRFPSAGQRREDAAGTPLTDEDRWPWLRAIAREIDAMRARGESGGRGLLGTEARLSRHPDRRPARCGAGLSARDRRS